MAHAFEVLVARVCEPRRPHCICQIHCDVEYDVCGNPLNIQQLDRVLSSKYQSV